MPMKKKLIEVALPLEAMNAESAKEKSIRFGHPSTLHLWWARRPLATTRAVIWASLVDDPSSHPERFPDAKAQADERKRLFGILSQLVIWENSNNSDILSQAKREIEKSMGTDMPELLDPFAGGGAIPFEAQRLGLKAHAYDLNPVAVMINKAMIEIPPLFIGKSPVNPEIRSSIGGDTWTGAAGLAEDVRYYGEWMKKKAFERIGHLYPKVKNPNNNEEATVIAWIWARTAKCPNPACGCTIPLVSNYVLSKKKGQYAWIEPRISKEGLDFSVHTGVTLPKLQDAKKGRGACFICPACGEITLDSYIKDEGKTGRIGYSMMAVVAEGKHGRFYLAPDQTQKNAANVEKPSDYVTGSLPTNPRWFSPPAFGMDNFDQLFTNRQLTALMTFCDLVLEARETIEHDAIEAGMFNDHIGIDQMGRGARAYADAVATYLSFGVSRMADIDNALCPWEPVKTQVRHLFGRQAIPMLWDFGENNVFNNAAGDYITSLNSIIRVINKFNSDVPGIAKQHDAQTDNGLRNIMISTDPPYYDNIGYADLSDFFYIWLRKTLKDIYPSLFRTMLVPKIEELVASPQRFNGSMIAAKEFFEDGMFKTCCQLFQYSRPDIPLTIYYAFKQSENENGENGQQTASTGWETMLSAIIRAGFSITGTWPMRTELTTGLKGGINALASSIVLVCRKRPEDAQSVTRREFINVLHRELRPALENLQSANIAPVDLAQSAIGPGIGVFSRYKSVLEADGKPMTVRAALQIINQELDAFYNEQEGEMDSGSRFCVDLFQQYGFNEMAYGEAQVLATAKNMSIQALADRHVLYSAKSRVHLLTRDEIPDSINSNEQCIWLLTQQLAYRFEKEGVKGCAKELAFMYGSNAENAKALAYRLYTICERKGWAQEGYAYNNLVVAWPEILAMAASIKAEMPEQIAMDLGSL